MIRCASKCHTITISICIALFLCVLGVSAYPFDHAQAQTGAATLTQIRQDSQDTAYTVGKVDKKVREVRTLVYITLALTLISVAVTILIYCRRSAGDEPATKRLAVWAAAGQIARLRKRQQMLARAVAELQHFADQAEGNHKELSRLLDLINRQMDNVDLQLRATPVARND